jgi:hypothetical protein
VYECSQHHLALFLGELVAFDQSWHRCFDLGSSQRFISVSVPRPPRSPPESRTERRHFIHMVYSGVNSVDSAGWGSLGSY